MAKIKQLNIPIGTTKEDIYLRRAIIVEHLWKLVGTSVSCKAFGDKKVEFIPVSIDETATHASKNYHSTIAALHVVEAIQEATLQRTTSPASQKQRKLKFKKVHELSSELQSVGNVKIIVGERASGRVLHYCITKKG